MVYRSSFSQHQKFDHYPRYWFYEKVLRIPYKSDMCYANAGSVIHNVLENWYDGKFKCIDEAKEYFNKKWDNFNLRDSKIFHTKEEYWLMCIEGIHKNLPITDTELKLEWDDFLGYIDVIDKNNKELYDWKSSKRREENEIEYIRQLEVYSWVYYRKFNIIPDKCTVFYLRYPGTKGVLSFIPTMDTVKKIEEWYYKLLKQMDEIKTTKKLPPKCKECSMWCPYKTRCENDNTQTVFNLHLRGNYIYINGNITKLLDKGLNNKFSYELKNSYFIKKHNPNANTIINFWDYRSKRLPIGFIHAVQKTLNDYIKIRKLDGVINIIDERVFNDIEVEMPDKFLNGRILREYQTDAVDKFLEKKIALIAAATGVGKTEIAIEIIRRLKMKTLFIVDKIELLNQTKKRIEDTLKIKVGIMGQSQFDLKDVTVATIQTIMAKTDINRRVKKVKNDTISKHWIEYALSMDIEKSDKKVYDKQKDNYYKQYVFTNNEKLEISRRRQEFIKDKTEMTNYFNMIRFVIFDECHKISANSFWKISQHLINTEYRAGLSATIWRDDGNTMYINAVTGYSCISLSAKSMIQDGWLAKPTIIFIKDYMDVNTIQKLEYASRDGLINEEKQYKQYYDNFVSNNIIRNNLIKQIVQYEKGKKILILVKYIEHGEYLSQLLNVPYLFGDTKKEQRISLFNDFSNKKLDVLIGTISIFSEGIDIPRLYGVINAAANAGDIKTIQLLGRVMRLFEGKEPVYYDFIDESDFFKYASNKRKRIFRKQGHDVKVIGVEDFGK